MPCTGQIVTTWILTDAVSARVYGAFRKTQRSWFVWLAT